MVRVVRTQSISVSGIIGDKRSFMPLKKPILLTNRNIGSFINLNQKGFIAKFVFYMNLEKRQEMLAVGPLNMEHKEIARNTFDISGVDKEGNPDVIGGPILMHSSVMGLVPQHILKENKVFCFTTYSMSQSYGNKHNMVGMISYLEKILEDGGIKLYKSEKSIVWGYDVFKVFVLIPKRSLA